MNPRAARTSRFWTHVFRRVSNHFNALRRSIQPIPDMGVPHLQTCERMPSSIPHGGRLITVQRRGVDAGEREEPGRTSAADREFMRGRRAEALPLRRPVFCWSQQEAPHVARDRVEHSRPARRRLSNVGADG